MLASSQNFIPPVFQTINLSYITSFVTLFNTASHEMKNKIETQDKILFKLNALMLHGTKTAS